MGDGGDLVLQDFISHLLCPKCRGELLPMAKYLTCRNGHSFSTRNGLIRFSSDQYASNFGFQWKRFEKTQLDSYTNIPITYRRLRFAMGTSFNKLDSHSKVLEVGCGAGRFTECLLATGATVYSIDISSAVDSNALNFPPSSRHFVAQADINQNPFPENFFDFIVCLGVLQHTPDLHKTVLSMKTLLKSEGTLVLDNYGKSISWFLRTAPIFRQFFKRLHPNLAFEVIQRIYKCGVFFYSLSNLRVYHKILNVIFPITYFHNEIPELSKELKYDWGLLDTFDSLTDVYKKRRSTKQINHLLRNIEFANIWVTNQSGTVVARCQKK